jgi:uncharacterized ferritin-like protein (DUF455 family)
MRFNAPLLAAVALALAGCGVTVGQVPWRDDVDRCAHDIRSASSSQQRSELVDRCMEAKGWRATRACREMQMQGSVAFCDYER